MNAPDRIPPTFSLMLKHPCHIFSLGFGSGLSPIMPGTAGTLFAWVVYDVLTYLFPHIFNPLVWGIICAIGFIAGIKCCDITGTALNSPDDGSMVWDEIVAFWLVLLFIMPCSFLMQLAGFVIFRFFDMVKPQPIRYFDSNIKGGFGVMLDDLIAAFFTLLVIAFFKFFAQLFF